MATDSRLVGELRKCVRALLPLARARVEWWAEREPDARRMQRMYGEILRAERWLRSGRSNDKAG